VIQTPYGSQGDIESVACPAAGSCVAVGYYTLPATPGLGMYGNFPLVATQVNGVWQPATSPGTPGDLHTVTCTAPGDCLAGGGTWGSETGSSSPVQHATVISEVNGSWGEPAVLQFPGDNELDGGVQAVACVAAGNCVASTDLFLATETNATWSPGTALSLPADADHDSQDSYGIDGMSCATTTNCVAVGDYVTTAGAWLPMIVTTVAPLSLGGTPPPAHLGVPYSFQPTVSGGGGGARWTIAQGTLPSGLSLNATTGAITGVPTTAGTTAATLSVATPGTPPQQASAALSITVSTPPPPPQSVPPALRRVRVSPATVSIAGRRIHRRCVAPSPRNRRHPGCRRPARLTLSYVLSSRATLRPTLARRSDGRIPRGRCVAPTRSNRRDRHCERWTSRRATASFASAAGTRRRLLPGALVAGLKPGRYRLTTTPTAGGTSGRSVSTRFQIVG
jgi:Putative Ig domain